MRVNDLRNKITLITTTIDIQGRQNAIRRFIEYHREFGLRIIIGVEDASYEALRGYQSEESVSLVTFRKDLGVFEKLVELCKRVDTPYLAWVADDDFMTYQMIELSCKKLDSDEGIVACDGLNVFLNEKSTHRSNYEYSFRQYINIRRFNKHIKNELVTRVLVHAHNFNPMLLHGVMRTRVFSEVVEEVQDSPIKWGDNISVLKVLSEGSVAMIPTASNIRSAGTRIMSNCPEKYNQSGIKKTDLVFDEATRNRFYAKYQSIDELTPQLKSAIDYFFLTTSRALPVDFRASEFEKKFLRLSLKILSFITFSWFLFTQTNVRRNIKVIKRLMKRYPV
jgi:glycosyltransferase domain-containing protein